MQPSVRDSLIGGTIILLIIITGLVVFGPWGIPKSTANDDWTAEPEFENSTYVGHFEPLRELRRVDDTELGITCYKVNGRDGLSCVPTPSKEPTE